MTEFTPFMFTTLRELAQKASSRGPWYVLQNRGASVYAQVVSEDGELEGPSDEVLTCKEADANFIAAVDPDIVLAILDKLEAATGAECKDTGDDEMKDDPNVIREGDIVRFKASAIRNEGWNPLTVAKVLRVYEGLRADIRWEHGITNYGHEIEDLEKVTFAFSSSPKPLELEDWEKALGLEDN